MTTTAIKLDLPTVEQLGPNFTRVHFGAACVWFSYKTPIAFIANGRRVVRENDWGPTTGKHLNAIDHGEKTSRVDGGEFARLWDETFNAD